MYFKLVFENSGDFIPVEVIKNHNFFEFYVETVMKNSDNLFENCDFNTTRLDDELNRLLLHIDKINGILTNLPNAVLLENPNSFERSIDQDFLNKNHALWVKNEYISYNIDDLRASNNEETKNIGDFLHSCYPDEIRTVTTSEIFAKYGLLHEFQECNMGVHRTESFFFNNDEYSSTHKWDVFENIFVNDVETNNGITNFNIGHTYVGRQNYDKFSHFDMDLTYNDFYNFEKIEYSFNFNLSKPENIPFSEEFINWSKRHNQKPKGLQIPIGNVVDLESNLTKYRTVLYTNIKSNNKVSIEI